MQYFLACQLNTEAIFWQCTLFFLNNASIFIYFLGDLVGLVTPPLFAQSIKGNIGHEEGKLG